MAFIYIVIGALIFLISWIWASSYFKRKEKERLESINHKISSIIENKREVHSGGRSRPWLNLRKCDSNVLGATL